tara:strand:- start:345 stop:491 length:147 start_codon:yes stop_codon:yes gene_type:complete
LDLWNYHNHASFYHSVHDFKLNLEESEIAFKPKQERAKALRRTVEEES